MSHTINFTELFRNAAANWCASEIDINKLRAQEIMSENATSVHHRLRIETRYPSQEHLRYLWDAAVKQMEDPDSEVICTTEELATVLLNSPWFKREGFRYSKNLFRFRIGLMEVRLYREGSGFGESCRIEVPEQLAYGFRWHESFPSLRHNNVPFAKGIYPHQYAKLIKELFYFLPEALEFERSVEQSRVEVEDAWMKMNELAKCEFNILRSCEAGRKTARFKELLRMGKNDRGMVDAGIYKNEMFEQ